MSKCVFVCMCVCVLFMPLLLLLLLLLAPPSPFLTFQISHVPTPFPNVLPTI